MSFTFDQRKRPREQTKAEAGRATEPGPSLNVMTAGQAAAPAGEGSSNLEAVMQERMRDTFGDLGAVREARKGPSEGLGRPGDSACRALHRPRQPCHISRSSIRLRGGTYAGHTGRGKTEQSCDGRSH